MMIQIFRTRWIIIVSRKHGGPSTAGNLAYACVVCNRFKGSDVASILSGSVTRLFDPLRDRCADHFRFEFPRIEPITDIGRVTTSLLRMNAPERLVERSLLGPGRFKVQV